MGAKTRMLVYAQHNARDALMAQPILDREATLLLAAKLFPDDKLEQLGETTLDYAYPPNGEIYIGQFPGVAIVAAKEFGIDYPSRLPAPLITNGPGGLVYLHTMHSGVDWFAYAHWENGKLIRSLSLSPDDGVAEDIGNRHAFEEPFWSGQHPALDPNDSNGQTYPFAFHPLELAEATLAELFGYQIEGPLDLPQRVDPESIPLLRFKRQRPFKWKFWR